MDRDPVVALSICCDEDRGPDPTDCGGSEEGGGGEEGGGPGGGGIDERLIGG